MNSENSENEKLIEDNEMYFSTINENNKKKILYNTINNCIICMEGLIEHNNNNNNKTIKETPIMVNSIPFLQKKCICDYSIHYKCIDKWLETNSICPICRNPISNILKNITHQTQIIIPNEEHNSFIISADISDPHPTRRKCITLVSYIICFMISLIIINNFIYTFIY